MSDLIKRIDEELATQVMPEPVRRLLRYCKAKQLLLKAINESLREQNRTLMNEQKFEIERLSKPYVPMTDDELVEEFYNTPDYSYLPEDCGYERHYELTAIARYNEQRGVK